MSMFCHITNTVYIGNYADAFAIIVVSITEKISPTKSVGRAAVMKPIDPIEHGMPPAESSESLSVAELATTL